MLCNSRRTIRESAIGVSDNRMCDCGTSHRRTASFLDPKLHRKRTGLALSCAKAANGKVKALACFGRAVKLSRNEETDVGYSQLDLPYNTRTCDPVKQNQTAFDVAVCSKGSHAYGCHGYADYDALCHPVDKMYLHDAAGQVRHTDKMASKRRTNSRRDDKENVRSDSVLGTRDVDSERGMLQRDYQMKEYHANYRMNSAIPTRSAGFKSSGQLELSISRTLTGLKVQVLRAQHLRNRYQPKCTSYAQVEVKTSYGNSSTSVHMTRTRVVPHSNSPIFNEITAIELKRDHIAMRLHISMWHYDATTQSDHCLGCMSFGIQHLLSRCQVEEVRAWYFLLNEDLGKKKHLLVRKRTLKASSSDISVPKVNAEVLSLPSFIIQIQPPGESDSSYEFTLLQGSCPAKVNRVMRNGVAAQAGLKDGDIIARVRGQNVSRSSAESVADIIRLTRDVLVLEVRRSGPSSDAESAYHSTSSLCINQLEQTDSKGGPSYSQHAWSIPASSLKRMSGKKVQRKYMSHGGKTQQNSSALQFKSESPISDESQGVSGISSTLPCYHHTNTSPLPPTHLSSSTPVLTYPPSNSISDSLFSSQDDSSWSRGASADRSMNENGYLGDNYRGFSLMPKRFFQSLLSLDNSVTPVNKTESSDKRPVKIGDAGSADNSMLPGDVASTHQCVTNDVTLNSLRSAGTTLTVSPPRAPQSSFCSRASDVELTTSPNNPNDWNTSRTSAASEDQLNGPTPSSAQSDEIRPAQHGTHVFPRPQGMREIHRYVDVEAESLHVVAEADMTSQTPLTTPRLRLNFSQSSAASSSHLSIINSPLSDESSINVYLSHKYSELCRPENKTLVSLSKESSKPGVLCSDQNVWDPNMSLVMKHKPNQGALSGSKLVTYTDKYYRTSSPNQTDYSLSMDIPSLSPSLCDVMEPTLSHNCRTEARSHDSKTNRIISPIPNSSKWMSNACPEMPYVDLVTSQGSDENEDCEEDTSLFTVTQLSSRLSSDSACSLQSCNDVITDVIQCEEHYSRLMQEGIQNFSRPLRHALASNQTHAQLFQNIEKLAALAGYNLRNLTEAGDVQADRLVEVYRATQTILKDAYQSYIDGYSVAVTIIDQCLQSSQVLDFLERTNHESCYILPVGHWRSHLEKFITLPVVHIVNLYKRLKAFEGTVSRNGDYCLANVIAGLQPIYKQASNLCRD